VTTLKQKLGLVTILLCVPTLLGAAPISPETEALLNTPITPEMIIRTSAIIVLFIFIASLIATRRLPAMIALPIMAFGIGICAGIPILDVIGKIDGKEGVTTPGILTSIIEGGLAGPTGMFMLTTAIIYTLLGGMFARLINDARIAERLIKYTAEFGGEDPFFISLLMSAVTALVFTAIGGLPAMIMLGTVMFPILLSLGVPPIICGCILAMAFPIGAALGPANWGVTANMYGINTIDVVRYCVCWAILQFSVLLIFLTFEFLRMRRSTVTVRSIIKSVSIIVLSVLFLIIIGKFEVIFDKGLNLIDSVFYSNANSPIPQLRDNLQPFVNAFLSGRLWLLKIAKVAVTFLLLFGIVHSQYVFRKKGKNLTQWNLLTPLLPLVFILLLDFHQAYGAAFICSIGYGFLTTPADRSIQKLGKTIIAGIGDIAAPVVLMMGIGMLVSAARNPATDALLTPVLAKVMPHQNTVSYVLFFTFFAPFALYRGPLNEWGLGVGVARILQSFMPPAATMGAIKAVSMLQDPTTTHNVWICGYLKLDINSILFKLLPYSFMLIIGSLIVSAYLFLP